MRPVLNIISYAGWIAATLVGILGSWKWNLTQPDPDDASRKNLSPKGRWVLGIFIFSLICSLTSSILSDIIAAKDRQKAITEKNLLHGRLELLRGQNDDLNSRLTQVLRRHGIWDIAAGDRVLHDKLMHLRKSIPGRAEERGRIEKLLGKPIPFDGLGIMASFNLNAMSLKRNPYWTEELAGIISFMEADVVFLQEIPDQNSLLAFRKLLPQYDVRWLRFGNLRYRTGLAILYRRATVDLIDEPEIIGEQDQFARLPITQRIKLGDMDMRVVNLHLTASRDGDRINELKSLLKFVSQRYRKSDLILAGVFQWDERRPQMGILREHGFYLVTGELPEDATESPISSRIYRFSNLALSENVKTFYITGSVHYLDLRSIYPNLTREDWRGFVDHNPLLIAFSTKNKN